MDILLGYWLDSDSYPDALGSEEAVAGRVVTGLMGFVGILETQLGLAGPKVSENIRIAEWQELLRKYDTGKQPYSKSFETDSWNTAKELLRRRDELVLAGWNPMEHKGGGKWIETLAQIELDETPRTNGFPDRVQAILSKLQNPVPLQIHSITIVDKDLTLWEPWAVQLIDLIKKQEVLVEVNSELFDQDDRVEDPTDLSLLKSILKGEASTNFARGDGSLLLVRSEQEWDAVDFLTTWLQDNASEDTVLIKGEGSLLLDELLHRRGVPAIGVEASSKWRAIIQVLPLTIDTYWEPLRVDRLMELLTIPTSPVPGRIRYKLATALANLPGIDSPQWREAIDKGIEEYEAVWKEDGLEEKEIKLERKKINERLNLFVNHEYYDPHEGIPVNTLVNICLQINKWAASSLHRTQDQTYSQVIQYTKEIIEGIKSLGVERVTRLQVVRIIDSVIGSGTTLSNYKQEASEWYVVNHPGQIWQRAETVIWWGFNKSMSGPNIRTWTEGERQWLAEHHIQLIEDDVRRRREALSWQHAAMAANKQLILLAPIKLKGKEMPLHPFWDEIRYAVAQDNPSEKKITMDASSLRKQSDPEFIGQVFGRIALHSKNIPEPIRKWQVPVNTVSPREIESATSFEQLMGCSLSWTFQYAANVRPGSLLSLPHESIMLGNLGHTILEYLLTEKTNWEEFEIGERVIELFDELTPKLAAPLLEPQNGILRNETKMKLQHSIRKFFSVLNDAGVQLKHTELDLQKPWNDTVEFKGRLDLVGETQSGQKIFFDAKWSGNPKRYREKLETLSVQLSLYHWLLSDDETEELPVAYFMLRQGEFFTLPNDNLPRDYHVEGPSLVQSYQLVQKSVENVWNQLARGTIIAPGVPSNNLESEEKQDDSFEATIEPPCKFCSYQNICGFRRVETMTGKLTMLSAGAGAGKTYRLSSEIVDAVKKGVPPENIMATTFTIKAADELIERVRLRLLESGEKIAAARILDGYVGTMNSVFGRLLREFALEMGLSPVQKVLGENEASQLFHTIAAEVIDKFYRDYRQVFFRLGQQDNWRDIVLQIIKIARENGMDSSDVQDCADYSWTRMAAWLPEALPDADKLDMDLRTALVQVNSVLPGGDKTKSTKTAVDIIKYSLVELDRYGSLTWQQWVRLSKLSPAKASMDAVSPIHAAASVHARHPRLHEDLKKAMYALFHCAKEAMETYAEEKSKRGLIDFTDQEALALGLLKDKENFEVLKDRISEVFVDEFQDSSPLQIALAMQLREIADGSTWVGDVKQAIYGFRGTDPALMNTAMVSVPDMNVEILDASWRSRKSLVEFVNSIFVPVFEARGLSADKIALDPKRDDDPEQALALEAWSYPSSKNKTNDALHLATGVQQVIKHREKYQVVDKVSRKLRPLKPNDIAILCRANDECTQIAEALGKLGIPATVGESGLLATPEAVYAQAALRYLIDRNDSLALAEIIHFSSETLGEGKWLSEWLQTEDRNKLVENEVVIRDLDEARYKIDQMSPSEVLDLALAVAKVDEMVLKWGNGDERLANLDALRSLAVHYEETSETNGTAATTSGFLLFLNHVNLSDDDLNKVAESTNEQAVQVLTYHSAKGLEWPFVILNSLDKSSERSIPPVFDRTFAVSTTDFNVQDPLNGRSLYYWPWPYGKQSKDVELDVYVEGTRELKERKQQLIEENQRLMYVGMTRARDYLVFVSRNFSKIGWLNELMDAEGQPVVSNLGVPIDDNQSDVNGNKKGELIVNGTAFPCGVKEIVMDESSEDVERHEESEVVYVGKIAEQSTFVPARFSPSQQTVESTIGEVVGLEGVINQKLTITTPEIIRIGDRLPLSSSPEMDQLGDMVHAFLGADNLERPKGDRLAMAEGIIERFGIHALTADAMLTASERLQQFIDNQYPDLISKVSEWPIHLRKGDQRASGWIDLLIETSRGYVIIDHKSFPGREDKWIERGIGYLPQLKTYATAIEKATGKPVYQTYIHMPIVGTLLQWK